MCREFAEVIGSVCQEKPAAFYEMKRRWPMECGANAPHSIVAQCYFTLILTTLALRPPAVKATSSSPRPARLEATRTLS